MRGYLRDLAKSATEHEADEIRAHAQRHTPAGGEPLVDRRPAAVTGVLRSVTLPPVRSVPVLTAELFDGDRSVELIWIGRRRIVGIEPGVVLRAEGRVSLGSGVPRIVNPTYTLIPT